MSNFTKSYTVELSFEDDVVTLRMSRMKRKDALKLIPYMGEPDEQGNVPLTFASQVELMDVAADLLPKYIADMTGLKDEDGNALTVEEMLDEAYFLTLVGEIVNVLMTKSFVSKDAEKKLDVPQEKNTEVSAPISNSE